MTDKLSPKQEKVLSEVYTGIQDLVEDLQDLGAVSREFSIVLTKLEEAEMWSERGFEVKGYEPEDEDDDEDDEDESAAEDSDETEDEDGE